MNLGLGSVAILTGAMPVGAYAVCSAVGPGSNTTVTCGGAAIPSVVAVPGSTNVAIDIDGTATGSYMLATTPTPFSVDTSSSITNNGNLSMSGNGSGVANRGAMLIGVNNGNTVTNGSTGVITTTGAYNDGIAANGNNNTLVNNGTITTSGNNAYGMTAAWGQSNPGASGNTLINTGPSPPRETMRARLRCWAATAPSTTAARCKPMDAMRRPPTCRATTTR
nr:hypothetical protein [Burkholderia gladioli]